MGVVGNIRADGQYYADYVIADAVRAQTLNIANADKFATIHDSSMMVVGVRTNDIQDTYGSHTVYVLFNQTLNNKYTIAVAHSGQLIKSDQSKMMDILKTKVEKYTKVVGVKVKKVEGTYSTVFESEVTQYVVALKKTLNEEEARQLFSQLYIFVDRFQKIN